MRILKILVVLFLCSLFSQMSYAAQLPLKVIFTIQPLSKSVRKQMMANKSWKAKCPVPLNRLNQLTITYYDFSGKQRYGHLIVFDAAAPFMLNAFEKMYAMRFPLETVEWKANQNKGGQTMSFNCRNMVGESKFSIHSYGLAIDINILHNPYIGDYHLDDKKNMIGTLIPFTQESYTYLNRTIQRPGMNEQIVEIMKDSGFVVWGGQWQDRIDYQHFQVPDNLASQLAYLDKESGEQLMKLIAQYPESAIKISADTKWKYLYQLYPRQYISALTEFFPLFKTENENDVFNKIYQQLSQPNPQS